MSPATEMSLRSFRQAEPRFNLVLLDLMLPGMSGYEICREIRLIDKQVPILVLSTVRSAKTAPPGSTPVAINT